MKTVLIIQARMGSVRLPGKSMKFLCGKPLLGHIFERVKRVRMIDSIMLATSELKENDPLVRLADDYGITSFRGSEWDLLGRYYHAAKSVDADLVLRLPADNVCPEPFAFDELIEYHKSINNDFSSNICSFMGNGWPDGIGVEAINFDALERAHKLNKAPLLREHVALNFYDYVNDRPAEKSMFKVGTIPCAASYSRPDIVLEVNTNEDLTLMRDLYGALYPRNKNFSIKDVINWFDERKGRIHG